MEKIFEDMKKTISSAARTVARKSGKIMETSKITLAISGANSDIKEEYEKIGELIYKSYKNGEASIPDIAAHCELIDAKLEQIEQYREKLGRLKNVKLCPACKAQLSSESTFCAKCGEKL